MPSDRKINIEMDGTVTFFLFLIVINLAVIGFNLSGIRSVLGEIKDVLKQQPVKVEQEKKQ
jgi:hypothetical protein